MAVFVSFSAEIVPKTTEALIAVLSDQANKQVDEVYLMLSTPGGSVMHGFNLYNAMKAFPFNLITHNVGNVDSIGNIVFLAGRRRFACANSTFMFHGVGFDTMPGMRLEEKFLQERLDSILQDQRRMGAVIRAHTNLNDGQIQELFREARTKDANYALGVGIVHEVRDVQIPPGQPVISLVFQR